MKSFSEIHDLETVAESVVRVAIPMMAFAISVILFTQFFQEYAQAVNSYPPLQNTHLKVLVNSKLFSYLLFANIFAFGLFINAILKEVYLVIILILETALLLHNRPKHLKGVENMTKEEFYTDSSILKNMERARPIYVSSVLGKKRMNQNITCGSCHKPLTENEYVYYNGYCDDCLYEVNNKALKFTLQDEAQILLANVSEFSKKTGK